jgi:cell division transport system permease protein
MRAPGLAPPSRTPYLVAVVAGAMAFIALCAVEAAQGAARAAGFWESGLSGVATVRLPGEAAGQAEAVAAALAAVPGVLGVRPVPADEAAALLLPWLGEGLSLDTVPLPTLLDVTLADPAPGRDAAQAAVSAVAPAAVYDDHAAWRAPVGRAAAALRTLTWGTVVLMGAALAAMVIVAARASLAGAAATVRTLRLLGARDGLIAASFDRGIALRAAAGAAVGAPLAAFSLRALPLAGLGEAMGAPPMAVPFPWIAVVAMPVACGLLAYATARGAIMVMLREAP